MYESLLRFIISNTNFEIACADGNDFINVILHDDNKERYWDDLEIIEELLNYLDSLSKSVMKYNDFTEYTIDDPVEGDFIITVYKATKIQKYLVGSLK